MSVSWDALGAIAEFIGSIAVIVTLLYLSFQIRQNTSAIKSQRYDERTRALREINMHTSESEWFWEVVEKLQEHLGTTSPLIGIEATVEEWKNALETLTPTQFGKLLHHQLSIWNHYQNMFYQHENDFLDDALFEASKNTVKRYSRLWVALGFSQKGMTEFDDFIQEASQRGGV